MHPGHRKKRQWREEKERLLKMTLEERRKIYVRDFVPLKDIMSWMEEVKSRSHDEDENSEELVQVKRSLSEKVSLYRGDITLLEIDAIINADPQTRLSSSSFAHLTPIVAAVMIDRLLEQCHCHTFMFTLKLHVYHLCTSLLRRQTLSYTLLRKELDV